MRFDKGRKGDLKETKIWKKEKYKKKNVRFGRKRKLWKYTDVREKRVRFLKKETFRRKGNSKGKIFGRNRYMKEKRLREGDL